jgi:hypothetical protein
MEAAKLGRRLAAAGALFTFATTLWGADSWLALPFALWAGVPYLALAAVAASISRSGPVLGAGLAGLTAEAAIRAAVFLWPKGSTAAVALVFSPAYILLLIMPAGAALGWLIESVWDKAGPSLRAAIGLAAGAALLFEFLAIGRPEWLPMNLAKDRAVLAALGEPRVVENDGFADVLVSSASAWYQVAELDGLPGEEALVVTHRGAAILDGATFQRKDYAAFTGDPGGMWSWYSRLVAMEDGYAVAQTGGGFQPTELLTLDGRTLWRYKPDGNMNPTALRPADLDGDGAAEFYAASNTKVCRLDGAMKEVWCVPAANSSIPVLAPKRGKQPGWLVVVEYRRMIRVLDAEGQELGSFVPSRDFNPASAADLDEGRVLLSGGKRLLLSKADGVRVVDRYNLPEDGLTVVNAEAVRFKKGEPPLLAVLSAPATVPRFRLRLVGPAGDIRYEEVFDQPVGLLPLTRPDGTQVLLLHNSGRLRALSRGTVP